MVAGLVEWLKKTPWLARLSRPSFRLVVASASLSFGVVVALIIWAMGEDVTASFVGGALGAIALALFSFLLWGELRTFWPERRG